MKEAGIKSQSDLTVLYVKHDRIDVPDGDASKLRSSFYIAWRSSGTTKSKRRDYLIVLALKTPPYLMYVCM
jgi:hypothetical protein